MKHIKYLEKFVSEKIQVSDNIQNEYYSNEEIIEFFQMFLDQHVFTYQTYDTSLLGVYFMEFNKIIGNSMLKYEETYWSAGYSDPDLILGKLLFLKDLTPIKKRLENAGYIFNFEFEMNFSNVNGASIAIVLHGNFIGLKE